MDTQAFYGRKRKNVTVRMAGGDEGENDEEVVEDSDSEYTPETELIGNQSARPLSYLHGKTGKMPVTWMQKCSSFFLPQV